jgi:hypothetical protein
MTDEAAVETAAPLKFYCPGCGAQSDSADTCNGKAESPHPAISMVSTKELEGDEAKHTAAPNTD